MIVASRCVFCDRILFVAPSERETFRAVIIAHLLKCDRAPSSLAFADLAEIVDRMIHETSED